MGGDIPRRFARGGGGANILGISPPFERGGRISWGGRISCDTGSSYCPSASDDDSETDEYSSDTAPAVGKKILYLKGHGRKRGYRIQIVIPDSLKYLFLRIKMVIVFLVVFFLISKIFDLIFDNSTPEFYRTINPPSQ